MDARRNSVSPRQFDIVFSNAALHWVDDHPAFLRGAAACLNPGGRLVVSCGGKGNAQDVFVALRPEMRLKRWREFFRKMPKAVFFSQPGGLRKMAAAIRFQNARASGLSPKDAVYDGARTVLPRGCARPGCLTPSACRKICARNSSPPSRTVTSPNIRRTRRAAFTSAWCGWKLMR